jgi:hypothetical protein
MLVLVPRLVHVEVEVVVEGVVAVDGVEVVVPVFRCVVVARSGVVGAGCGSKRVVILGVGGDVECVFPVVDG